MTPLAVSKASQAASPANEEDSASQDQESGTVDKATPSTMIRKGRAGLEGEFFPKFENLEDVRHLAPTIGDSNSVCSNDGSACTISSDFVEKFNKREADFRTKEDQDVAVFLSLVDKMSVKSLLFILQGHAKSMHNVHGLELQKTLDGIMTEQSSSRRNQPKRRRIAVKKCRFAEVYNGVRTEFHEILHVKDYSEEEKDSTWWSITEMRNIKREASKVVSFFRKYRPEYTESVAAVACTSNDDSSKPYVEKHMKELTRNSMPRGLESHILPPVRGFRENGIQSVLKTQRQGKDSNDWGKLWMEIFDAYVSASEAAKIFARRMAKCDHIEALKSSISRWDSGIFDVSKQSAAPNQELKTNYASRSRSNSESVTVVSA